MNKNAKFLDLPEYLFHQLMEWLTLDEFSLLDYSFCCHDKRDLILNCISSSTIRSPLIHTICRQSYLDKTVTTRGQLASYWSWLQTRKIYFKEIHLRSIKEASLFTEFYINSLTKKSADILGKTMKVFSTHNLNRNNISNLESILMTNNFFICLESFSCYNCLISDVILNSILSYSTKLNTILISNLPHITDAGLSSSLAVCQSKIQELTIAHCPGITGTNISPSLLTNLTLFHYYGDGLEGLPSMSLGLTGLQKLLLCNMNIPYSFREIFINMKSLTEIEVSHSSSFSGVNLQHAISASVKELTLKNCVNLTYGGLCDILTNNLTNLVVLELHNLQLDVEDNGQVRHLPPLPSSLVCLTLNNMHTLTDKELNELFSKDLPALDSLEMTKMDMVTGNDGFTFSLPSHLYSLKISLSQFSDAGLQHLLSSKPQSLSRTMINCPKITGEGFIELSPQYIFDFNFSNCGITSKGLCDILSNDWPELDCLDLSFCNIIDCGESFRFLTSNLCSLCLSHNSGMTDDGLYHLFLHNNLINLTHLNLNNLSNITNLALRPSLPQSLMTLDICGMSNLTDLGLTQLLSNNLNNLRILKASSCETITCNGLTGVLPPRIEYLSLSTCKSLTYKGLFDLLMNCSSSLKRIDISNSGVDKKDSNTVKFILHVTAPNATLIAGTNNELIDF
eukprot:gene10704-14372_t